MYAQRKAQVQKLTDLKEELTKSDNGDTFRHGEVVDKILKELLDAEIGRINSQF